MKSSQLNQVDMPASEADKLLKQADKLLNQTRVLGGFLVISGTLLFIFFGVLVSTKDFIWGVPLLFLLAANFLMIYEVIVKNSQAEDLLAKVPYYLPKSPTQ